MKIITHLESPQIEYDRFYDRFKVGIIDYLKDKFPSIREGYAVQVQGALGNSIILAVPADQAGELVETLKSIQGMNPEIVARPEKSEDPAKQAYSEMVYSAGAINDSEAAIFLPTHHKAIMREDDGSIALVRHDDSNSYKLLRQEEFEYEIFKPSLVRSRMDIVIERFSGHLQTIDQEWQKASQTGRGEYLQAFLRELYADDTILRHYKTDEERTPRNAEWLDESRIVESFIKSKILQNEYKKESKEAPTELIESGRALKAHVTSMRDGSDIMFEMQYLGKTEEDFSEKYAEGGHKQIKIDPPRAMTDEEKIELALKHKIAEALGVGDFHSKERSEYLARTSLEEMAEKIRLNVSQIINKSPQEVPIDFNDNKLTRATLNLIEAFRPPKRSIHSKLNEEDHEKIEQEDRDLALKYFNAAIEEYRGSKELSDTQVDGGAGLEITEGPERGPKGPGKK